MGLQKGRGTGRALQGFSHCHVPTDFWEITLKCKSRQQGCVRQAWTAKPCGGGEGPASPLGGWR